ncbi:unnamed protein product [Dibothriocephalus latus]|uniref:Uncharacterized protein n=1 Tax=Dibothriocephalus latus TaxID=60516 RepID=A0A3P6TJQ3_DIBLA|nr:unnamed protein product [Dibothriocephalus latus]
MLIALPPRQASSVSTRESLLSRRNEVTVPPVLLGSYPPPIAASERHLPRVTRCTLAQLRSGYCMLLRQYQHRLDPSIPDCGVSPHDCRHLFACISRPGTHLTPANLWLKPVEVATFLRLPTTPSLDSGGDS